MANKVTSSFLNMAAAMLAAVFVAPCAFADAALPPELINLPQTSSTETAPTATPNAASQTVTTTTKTTTEQPSSTDPFQQWLQSNGGAQPSSSVMPVPPAPLLKSPLSYEQSKQTMLDTVPESPPPSDDAVTAFDAMMQQNMPLSPQQVVKLRQQIDTAQRAASITPVIPPKPVSTTIMVNLAPGTTPPAIRLAQGYVTSLVFVDSTGSPWPISQFDIGNPKTVTLQWDGKSNIILIQAISPYSSGDMVVRLVGLPTPITLEIVSGQRVVDYRVDLHVSGIGPNTKELPIGSSLPNNTNQLLLGVLDGVAPAGSKLLTVHGADAQAWIVGQTIYLRTRLTLLSPGWIGKMVSPDGMQAYELPRTSSVLVSRYGEPVELKVEGF